MRCRWKTLTCAALAAALTACPAERRQSAPPFSPMPMALPTSTMPPPNAVPALDLATVADECARLIGSINAGVELVGQMSAKGSGDEQFELTAKALDAVGRTIEASIYRTPDLQRLAGFYLGVAKAQAQLVRDVGQALDQADEVALKRAEGRLQSLAGMEDTIVEEVNMRCRGTSGEPASVAPAASGSTTPGSVPSPSVVSGPR